MRNPALDEALERAGGSEAPATGESGSGSAPLTQASALGILPPSLDCAGEPGYTIVAEGVWRGPALLGLPVLAAGERLWPGLPLAIVRETSMRLATAEELRAALGKEEG